MSFFSTTREKRYWLGALIVLAAIITSLFAGQWMAEFFSDQNVQAVIFLTCMILIGVAIIIHGLQKRPGRYEIAALLGISGVFIMLFLRLGLAERSHLMEYSVLALFTHKALQERMQVSIPAWRPALIAGILAFAIGILDECVQLLLPNRVFDPIDIIFNGIAVSGVIGSSLLLRWLRGKMVKNNM